MADQADAHRARQAGGVRDELIRAPTGEGRARAKANGKSLGRPFKMTKHQRREALARRESGELLTEIARSYNVSAATISRLGLKQMTVAPDAEARLNSYLAEQLRLLSGNDIPRSVFHYTTSQSMRAIIASGMLRAHNLGQMNDFAEGRYAASVMRAHIDRGYAVESNPVAMGLLSAMRRQLTSVDLSNVFALSFTSDGDEPGMWRLYSDRGRGFSFAIPTRDALTWAGDGHKGMFVCCVYDPKTLARFCAEALAKIIDIYLGDATVIRLPDPTDYAQMFLENISWFAPAFKPEVWSDEKEWRFIFARHRSEHKVTDGRHYIELPLVLPTTKNPQSITALCAGPDCDYEDDILPLQRVLYDSGFGGVGGDFPIYTSIKHATRPGRRPPEKRATTTTTT